MVSILVTNDDGYNAPGILALAQAMRELGEVRVIAPSVNQSASGHKKTLFTDISIQEKTLADGTSAIAVGGSPADSIALAALGVTPWPPTLVVSGINRGPNMGQDVTYSGTVTAALEATIQGVPAVAISLDSRNANAVEDYAAAARVALAVAKRVLEKGLPPFTILNVNVPAGEVKGLRLTRQGLRIYTDELERQGDICRIVGPEPGGVTDEEGTDLWAVHNGYASLTPLHLDLTAHRFVADLAAWDIKLG
ncbi:MAG: 5'/3'-nucleotidase SurE [Anaerolineae bacterium]|nr:5'/3'-nucleotidase SurE [Anaerolineae bacterium]